jgi:HJR/Mrr/RecB family endonuclease
MAKRSAPKKRKKSGKKQSNGLFWLTFILVAIAAWVAIFVVGLFVNGVRRAIQGIANTYDRLSATSPALAAFALLGVVVAVIALLAGIAWIAVMIISRRQAAAEAERQAHLDRLLTLEGLMALSPTEFEHAVGEMLTAQRYRKVQVHGGAGDLAADLTCLTPDGRSTVVQCKRYAPDNLVGSPAIQQFIGMVKIHHKADLGIFVTTFGYTLPAMNLAKEHTDYLRLIDGPECAEQMRQIT